MLFKDEHRFSLLPKCFFMSAIITASFLAGYLMFVDENNLLSWLKPYAINGDYLRQVVLLCEPYPYESESIDHAVCVGAMNFFKIYL